MTHNKTNQRYDAIMIMKTLDIAFINSSSIIQNRDVCKSFVNATLLKLNAHNQINCKHKYFNCLSFYLYIYIYYIYNAILCSYKSRCK